MVGETFNYQKDNTMTNDKLLINFDYYSSKYIFSEDGVSENQKIIYLLYLLDYTDTHKFRKKSWVEVNDDTYGA